MYREVYRRIRSSYKRIKSSYKEYVPHLEKDLRQRKKIERQESERA